MKLTDDERREAAGFGDEREALRYLRDVLLGGAQSSIDRDALLVLADEMERRAAMSERSPCRRWVSPDETEGYALRIREACGEVA